MIFLFPAVAAELSTIAVNHPQTIDFSILDTVVGAVIAIAAMIVVGAVLFKYGVVQFGGQGSGFTGGDDVEKDRLQKDRELRRSDRLELKEEVNEAVIGLKDVINELRSDIKEYARLHQECQRTLSEKYVQWEVFNRIMDELKKDRKERWDKFDIHQHDDSSHVVVLPRK